jgi:hypothetical protein
VNLKRFLGEGPGGQQSLVPLQDNLRRKNRRFPQKPMFCTINYFA